MSSERLSNLREIRTWMEKDEDLRKREQEYGIFEARFGTFLLTAERKDRNGQSRKALNKSTE